MARIRAVLNRTSTQSLVFVIGLIIFCWPMVAGPGHWTLGELFAFLFIAWGCGLLVLFLIGQLGGEDSDV